MLSISQLAEILVLISYFFSAVRSGEDLYLLHKDHSLTADDALTFLDNLFDFIFFAGLFYQFDSRKLDQATGLLGVVLSLQYAFVIVGLCLSILYKLSDYLEKRSFSRLHLIIFSAALVLITLFVVL